MATVPIDFSLLPDLSWGHLKLELPPEIRTPLSAYSETTDRADGAYLFAAKFQAWARSTKSRESLLRAALAEFVAMEETLPRDLKGAGINLRPIKILECPEPELHMVHHLRNLELHLQTSALDTHPITATAGSDSFTKDIWFTQNLDIQEVMSLNNVRRDLKKGIYTPSSVERLVDWFNAGQKEIGVNEIVMRAVIAFSKRIVSTYSL